MERNKSRKRWRSDKKMSTSELFNSDESENDENEDSCNMRENFANGVLCMFNLLQNMMPVHGKEDYLGKKIRKTSASLGMSRKLKQESTRNLKHNNKSKCSHQRPDNKTYIENTSSDDNDYQTRISNKFSSRRKAKKKYPTDVKSDDVNQSIVIKNTHRTKIEPKIISKFQSKNSKSTHQSKDSCGHELLRREPKRSKAKYYKIKEKDDANKFPKTNEAEGFRFKMYRKKAKEILDVLFQPNTEDKKIQSIQILKKNKDLLSVFLDEKRKLGGEKIPILKPKRNAIIHATTSRLSDSIPRTNIVVEPEESERKYSNSNDRSQIYETNHVPCSTKRNSEELLCNERNRIKQVLSRLLKHKDLFSNSKMQMCSEIIKDLRTLMNSMKSDVNKSFSVDSIVMDLKQFENNSEEHAASMPNGEFDNMSQNIFHSNTEIPSRYSDLSYVDFLTNMQSEVLRHTEETHHQLETRNNFTVNNNNDLLDINQSNHFNGNRLPGNFQIGVVDNTTHGLLHPVDQQHSQCLVHDTDYHENQTTALPSCLTDSKNNSIAFHDVPTAENRSPGSYVTLTNPF